VSATASRRPAAPLAVGIHDIADVVRRVFAGGSILALCERCQPMLPSALKAAGAAMDQARAVPIFDWEKLEPRTIIPGFEGRFAHSATMTFALWHIAKGARLPEHRHIHEQVVHQLEGKFEITVEGSTFCSLPGMVMAIPSNALHSGRALTDCRILDVFYPIREDYRFEGGAVLLSAALDAEEGKLASRT